jgi:hypothetical protein
MTSRSNASNTSGKKVNRTNNKKPYNYRPIQYGNRTFPSTSRLIVYLLTHNKKAKRTQTEIAQLCGVSQPCVCQLARDLK